MDEERKIRFVLPPLFLIGSIGWAVFSDSDTTLNQVIQSTFGLEIDDLGGMLALLAGGGVAVVTFGFLLGTLTIFVLRTTFRIGWNKYHEVFVSNDALDKIWHTIGVTDKQHQTVENELFAVATFDHETIKGTDKTNGIHSWLLRRWNAFNISATSTTALVVSCIVVWCSKIAHSWAWFLPVLVVISLFVWSAIVAYRDTMGMIEFQAKRLD